ncbi:MAG: hypothetical protein ACOY5W_07585, partial [Pseudomonadota bacterium]
FTSSSTSSSSFVLFFVFISASISCPSSGRLAKAGYTEKFTVSNNELSGKTTAAEIVSQAAGCKLYEVITAYKEFNRRMGVK